VVGAEPETVELHRPAVHVLAEERSGGDDIDDMRLRNPSQ
jgi:hypothetical protein